MDYFKPLQNISFYYSTVNKAVFLKSVVNVYLPPAESLATQDAFNVSPAEYLLKFSGLTDVSVNQEYIYDHTTLVRILPAEVAYDPRNPAPTKEILKSMINDDLKKKGVSFYSLTTVVYKKDGSKGGQATNTISTQSDIEIV